MADLFGAELRLTGYVPGGPDAAADAPAALKYAHRQACAL
jgi:hypothetical protein